MYCTRCGIEIQDRDKFCSQCGEGVAGRTPVIQRTVRLSRPMNEAKMAGVCAGFARYFDVDVTLIRILWCVLAVWPVPLFGLVAYIVAIFIMPKDPIALPAPQVERA